MFSFQYKLREAALRLKDRLLLIPVTEKLLTPKRKELDSIIQAHSPTLLDKIKTQLQEMQEESDEKALLPTYSIGSIESGEIKYRPSVTEEALELPEIRIPKACISPPQTI